MRSVIHGKKNLKTRYAMTARTLLEIYFSPDDLEFTVSPLKDKPEFFGLIISRGPKLDQHPFKFLISSNSEARMTKEHAISAIRQVLVLAKQEGEKLFTEEISFSKSLFCGRCATKEEYVNKHAPVIEEQDIDRITKELGEQLTSSPYKWEVWEDRYPKAAL